MDFRKVWSIFLSCWAFFLVLHLATAKPRSRIEGNGFGKRDVLSRRGGYFPISECYSDYECDYGMKCDPQFGFCIEVSGGEGRR
ncbi:hypothetical protein ACROYT_G033788 [Oculina patagonica]